MEEVYETDGSASKERGVNPKFLPSSSRKQVEINFLDDELIYPIDVRQWVSPGALGAKKGGTVPFVRSLKFVEKDLIPTSIGLRVWWRVCIDYRKLIEATREIGPSPIPFMVIQIVKDSRETFSMFPRWLSSYFRSIDPKDQ
ncbi:hypothetical protein Tco_1326854 [Tanacetum coccineum]